MEAYEHRLIKGLTALAAMAASAVTSAAARQLATAARRGIGVKEADPLNKEMCEAVAFCVLGLVVDPHRRLRRAYEPEDSNWTLEQCQADP